MVQERRPRILLADDYSPMLDAMRRLLEPVCEVVGSVSDGRALLAAALSLEPDVIVVDLLLAEVNGLDACREIMRAIPRSRVVLVTAAADPDLVRPAFDAGAAGFVRKELMTDDLPAAIETVLAGGKYCSAFGPSGDVRDRGY
jgi:DNA-binding NarL/FixJ family response regulator